MAYLLDADWVINALHGRRNAAETLVELADDGIAICWVTIGEIYEGAFGHPNPEAHLMTLRQFLHPLEKLNLDDPIMEEFAQIRSQLRSQGQIISDFDILLAATARHHDLTILTHNVRHFNRIPGLKLYANP